MTITYEAGKDGVKRPFAYDLINNKLFDLLAVKGVDRMTISNEGIESVKEVLGLNSCQSEVELRAIRNALVRKLGSMINVVLHIDPTTGNYKEGERPTKEDYEAFDLYNMYMSATTCVIDNELWNRGYSV